MNETCNQSDAVTLQLMKRSTPGCDPLLLKFVKPRQLSSIKRHEWDTDGAAADMNHVSGDICSHQQIIAS